MATGVLGWSPDDAWEACPTELFQAIDAYIDANTTAEDRKKQSRRAATPKKRELADRLREIQAWEAEQAREKQREEQRKQNATTKDT